MNGSIGGDGGKLICHQKSLITFSFTPNKQHLFGEGGIRACYLGKLLITFGCLR